MLDVTAHTRPICSKLTYDNYVLLRNYKPLEIRPNLVLTGSDLFKEQM